MSAEYKYIKFVQNADDKNIINCINIKSGSVLANIFYYKPWRRFIFTQAEVGVVFSQDCLEDVVDYMKRLNK